MHVLWESEVAFLDFGIFELVMLVNSFWRMLRVLVWVFSGYTVLTARALGLFDCYSQMCSAGALWLFV